MMMVAERCQKQGIYFAAVSWCPKVRRWKKKLGDSGSAEVFLFEDG